MRLERTTNSSNIMGSATGSSKRGGIIAHSDGQYVEKNLAVKRKCQNYINEEKKWVPEKIHSGFNRRSKERLGSILFKVKKRKVTNNHRILKNEKII